MERVSRRSLLATASATAAVAGVAVVAGPATSANAAPAAAAPAAPKAAPLSDHAVARVRDLASGEVDLFIGEKQVTVRNPELANAIAHAAQQHTAL